MIRPISFPQDLGTGQVVSIAGKRPAIAVVLANGHISEQAPLRVELNRLERQGWRIHVLVLQRPPPLRSAPALPGALPALAFGALITDEHSLATRLIALDVPHVHAHSIAGAAAAVASAAQIAGITYSLSADAGEVDDAPDDHVQTLMSRAVFTLSFAGVQVTARERSMPSRLKVARVYLGVAQQSAVPMSLAELLSACLRPVARSIDPGVGRV